MKTLIEKHKKARPFGRGFMFALPIFMGSDASAACGGCSELSEWQRSADEEGASTPTNMPGTATGNLSFAVWKHACGMF